MFEYFDFFYCLSVIINMSILIMHHCLRLILRIENYSGKLTTIQKQVTEAKINTNKNIPITLKEKIKNNFFKIGLINPY